jgi:hypothetical protein
MANAPSAVKKSGDCRFGILVLVNTPIDVEFSDDSESGIPVPARRTVPILPRSALPLH